MPAGSFHRLLTPQPVGPRPIRDVLQRVPDAIRRHRRALLFSVLGVTLVAVAVAFLLPERYESTFSVQIQVPEAGLDVSALQLLRRGVGENTAGIEAEWSDPDVIRVVCEGPSAMAAHDRCAQVLNTLVASRPKSSGAIASIDSLVIEAERVRERLSAARDSLESYQRSRPAMAPEQAAAEEARQRAQATTQRDELRAELATTSNLVADLERGHAGERAYLSPSNYPPPLRNDSVARLLNDLSDLEGQRGVLATTRSARNPDLAAMDEKIGGVERELRAILTRHERSLTSRIRSLDSTLASGTGVTTQAPAQGPRLEKKIADLEDLNRGLEDQLRGVEPDGTSAPRPIRVIAGASLPSEPFFTGPLFPLSAGSLLGLLLGVALALYLERLDTRLRGPEEIEAATDLPVLGVLPPTPDSGPVLPIRPVMVRGLVPKTPEETWEKPALREALDGLIAKLDIVGCDPKDGIFRSVAITGTKRGEGTTFVACNLALMSAARGRRTLLVDADLEAHGVVRFFRLSPSQPGLIEVLRGRTAIDQACVGYRVAEGDLNVLAAGNTYWGTEPDLLVFAFSEELNRAEHDYDTIIVSSPPQSSNGGTIPVAGAVDAILLVVGEGLTEREAVRSTLDRLEGSGGRVVGIVLNDPGGTA